MEKYVTFFLPCLLALMLTRLASKPVRAVWRVIVRSAAGLACLSLVNSVSGITGLVLPINAVTVLSAGFGGIPGLALVALLEML